MEPHFLLLDFTLHTFRCCFLRAIIFNDCKIFYEILSFGLVNFLGLKIVLPSSSFVHYKQYHHGYIHGYFCSA